MCLGGKISQAQPVVSLTGPATAKSGTSITVSLNVSNLGALSSGLAALGWSAGPFAGFTYSRPVSLLVDKGVQCSGSNFTCIASGMNKTEIPNGTVARWNIQIPKNVQGNVAFWPSALSAADSIGNGVPVAPGSTYVVKVSKH